MAVGGYYGYAPRGSGARTVWRPNPPAPPPARITYPGGVPPRVEPGPNGTWARVGGPYVRVGGRQPAGPPAAAGGAATPGGASPYAGAGFEPPTLPGGTYNPEHDIISEQSASGLRALEGRTDVSEARARTDYFNRLGSENSDYERANDALKKSYAQLASRQTEQQNAAGVLEGGARLLAAQKRAENEGKQGEAAKISHQRRLDALALELAPPDATNPLGGRRWQDLETGRTEAQRQDLEARKGQYTLAADESARAGNPGPPAARGKAVPKATRPKAPARRRHA